MGGNANFVASVATGTQAILRRPSNVAEAEIGVFGIFLLPLLFGLPRQFKVRSLGFSKVLWLAFIGMVAIQLSGCGKSVGQSVATPGVPSGAYFITVTATGNTSSASEKLTLMVQ
jgi:hypothetical protein